MQEIAVDVHKAKRLSKAGQELMMEYKFTVEVLEQKCLELRSLFRKLELLFTEKRQTLLKFLELYQTLDMVTKVRVFFGTTSSKHQYIQGCDDELLKDLY